MATAYQLRYARLTDDHPYEGKHKVCCAHSQIVTHRGSEVLFEGRFLQNQAISKQKSFDYISEKNFGKSPPLSSADIMLDVSTQSLRTDKWSPACWIDGRPSRNETFQDRDPCRNQASSAEAAAFVSILRNCAKHKDVHKGSVVHDELVKLGLVERCSDALVTMYAKCGSLFKAKELLDAYVCRDIFTWTAVISGYAQQGQGKNALACYEQMQNLGLTPDAVTFACILKACGSTGAVHKGQRIHDEIAYQGLLENDVVLGTALVDMYAKCGALGKARQLFQKLSLRNVITWSALITGYSQQGEGEQAYACYEQMQEEGFLPDARTYACILKACGDMKAVQKGEQIHEEISKQGLLGNDIVLGTALVDMYAKCGGLVKAKEAFEHLPYRDVTSWSALIAGYAQQGHGEEALNCFEQMQGEGLIPNAVTFTSVLKACSIIGAVAEGKKIHDEIARQGLLGSNFLLETALVDMYAKNGAVSQAQKVLDELPFRDISTWSALITGYAQRGKCEQAVKCLERMEEEGLSPDRVIFSSLLNACSHLGRVHDGHVYFTLLSKKYGIKPDLEHYTCMVDLFGRAGHIDKAVRVIQKMPYRNLEVWSALLGACRKWGDVHVGRWAFEHALQLDKNNTGAYVLMTDLYAMAGMQEDAENIEALRQEIETSENL